MWGIGTSKAVSDSMRLQTPINGKPDMPIGDILHHATQLFAMCYVGEMLDKCPIGCNAD